MKITRDEARALLNDFSRLQRFPKDLTEQMIDIYLDELMALVYTQDLKAIRYALLTDFSTWPGFPAWRKWYQENARTGGMEKAGDVVSRLMSGFPGTPSQASRDCMECYGSGRTSRPYLVTFNQDSTITRERLTYEGVRAFQPRHGGTQLPPHQYVAEHSVPCPICSRRAS